MYLGTWYDCLLTFDRCICLATYLRKWNTSCDLGTVCASLSACGCVCSRVRICLNELFHSEFRLQMWAVWPDDQIVFSRFGHFQQWKFALKHKNCTKVSWKLCPKSNKPEIYCQIFSNIGQSGGMLPNLVTLDVNKKCFWATNGRRVNITFYPDALK